MDLLTDATLAAKLHAGSQRVRVLTEPWFGRFGYCLHCASDKLNRTVANTPACDFRCPVCDVPYELKSGAGRLGSRVVDGAYRTMMALIEQGRAPNLVLLRYNKSWQVDSLTALHSVFLTPNVVEQRPPLAPTARRAGWVGCNLRLDRVPVDGRITLVEDGIATDKTTVRKLYAQSARLADLKPTQRGWTALVLAAVRKIDKANFTLAEVYLQEAELHGAYPENSHVRDKIRQQLQVLRDLGYLEFVGRGEYRILLGGQ